jgi:hypothetical protein
MRLYRARRAVTFAVLALGASAAATRAPAQTLKDRILIVDGDGHVYHTNDASSAVEVRVRGVPNAIMTALVQGYKDAGIPVGTLDSDHGKIGNATYRVPTHYLGGKRLSLLLDCGTEPMVGQRADLYDVWISALTTVLPESDSVTVVSTEVEGQARSVGEAGGTIHCTSTGSLEKAIADNLAKRLAG